jgi:AraC-like DNA-binding protein
MEIAAQVYMLFLCVSILLLYAFRSRLNDNQSKIAFIFFICLTLIPAIFLFITGKFYPSLSNVDRFIFFLFIPAAYVYVLFRLLKAPSGSKHNDGFGAQAEESIFHIKSLYLKPRNGTPPLNHKTVERHSASLHLTDERKGEMSEKIKEHFLKTKPFLQRGYSLRMLSEESQIPLHQLSAFINQHYKMNFNDFINEYRILCCIDKLLKNEWQRKKLEAIAEESGFNNRNTFTSAFKKATGLNPSEFLKYIKLGKLQKITSPGTHNEEDVEEMSKVFKLMSRLAG